MASRSAMFVLALAITAAICVPLALLFLADDGQRRQVAAARMQPSLPGAPMRAAARAERPRRKAVVAPRRRSANLSERRLRVFETRVLGPEHAREHAMQRSALRHAENAPQSSAPAAAAVAGDPADVGRWTAAFPIPVMAVHAAVLPTGKVMWFSYPKNPNVRHGGDGPASPNTAQAWLWDPATGQNTRVDPPLWRDPADDVLKPANIWCAGQSFTADGRVLVIGGNAAYSSDTSDFKGLNKAYTFNPFNETWTEQPDMRHGRWYPSAVRLSDGRMPILSGLDESGTFPTNFNTDVELFTPSSDLNGRGTMTLVGSRGGTGQPPKGGNYPHMFAMPSGRMLVAGPFPGDTWFMDPPGSSSFTWTDVPNMPADRLWGTAVLMPGGTAGSTRVMELGGSKPATITSTTTDLAVPTTEVFDESAPGAGWQSAPSMNVGRGHHNTVLLPDGSMATVGGGVGIRNGDQWEADEAQKQIELWNPTTGQWRLGPGQAENRAYHSIAMLLPDGRVISAGDDVHGGIDQDTAEIYEPPYLFKGARPTITWAPAAVRTSTSFEVDTPDPNITGATLIAPSAVTHAADMNERSLSLSVSQRAGGVTLTAPGSAAIAPDGYYMLFLLNDQGVPSVAKWVRLSVDGTLSALPEQPRPGPTGTKPKPLSLSRAAGARLARRALAKEFGRAFRKRSRFRQRCTRPKRAVVSCSVSWVFKKRKHFRGSVKVTKTGPKMSRYSMRVKRNFAGHLLKPVKRRGRLRLKPG